MSTHHGGHGDAASTSSNVPTSYFNVHLCISTLWIIFFRLLLYYTIKSSYLLLVYLLVNILIILRTPPVDAMRGSRIWRLQIIMHFPVLTAPATERPVNTLVVFIPIKVPRHPRRKLFVTVEVRREWSFPSAFGKYGRFDRRTKCALHQWKYCLVNTKRSQDGEIDRRPCCNTVLKVVSA